MQPQPGRTNTFCTAGSKRAQPPPLASCSSPLPSQLAYPPASSSPELQRHSPPPDEPASERDAPIQADRGLFLLAHTAACPCWRRCQKLLEEWRFRRAPIAWNTPTEALACCSGASLVWTRPKSWS